MGKRYLIDTNVIIDYTGGLLPDNAYSFIEKLFENSFEVSNITYIEVLGFNEVPEKLSKLEDLMNMASIVDLDNLVTKQTINLRRKLKIKLPDAIIAATAIAYNMTLVSRNEKDFAKIKDLNVINPYQL